MASSPFPASVGGTYPPGPPPRRGLVDSLGYYYRFATDPLRFVGDRFAAYGDIYRAPNPDGDLYVIKHPDHLAEVLITHASKYRKTHSGLRTLARFLGDGLLTSDGETWKRQRRMVQPAFSRARLADYAVAMREEAARASSRFRDGETREMSREMMELTLRVVSRTLFGHDVGAEIDDVARAMVTFQDSLTRPRLLPRWLSGPFQAKLERAIATIDRVIYGMIARRRAAGGEGSDLLGTLISAVDDEGDGGRLSEREVRDQLVTLFIAGHETTSHALTWTLYLLSQNPEAERALHAEIDGALGGRAVAYDDLGRLPYTEQVLKEAMRLYPPAYSVARKAEEDTEIGGYPVRRGSEVVLWIYMTHRDFRWFPDPTAFRPERFTEAEEAKLPKLAYLPFGAGPRVCIGKTFAMLEAKLILATLSQRFRFALAPGQRVSAKTRITLFPGHGMRMRIASRPGHG